MIKVEKKIDRRIGKAKGIKFVFQLVSTAILLKVTSMNVSLIWLEELTHVKSARGGGGGYIQNRGKVVYD